MELKHIPNRLEIAFWSAAIAIMSESAWLSEVVQFGHSLVEDGQYKTVIGKVLLWAGAGLALGLLLGFATA